MKSRLDEIEIRLQRWIESSAIHLPWMNPTMDLSHQLASAVYNNLSTTPDGKTIAPNQFTIYIPPESTAAWQIDEHTLQSLANALQQSVHAAGISFLAPPTLHVLSDPQLPPGHMRVQVIENDLSGQTAVMPVLSPSNPKPTPRNAPTRRPQPQIPR
jgi:hypothetical protein